MTEGPSRLERRHERTKESILAAALTVIREQGVEGLSLRLIAKELDMTPANLYRYFDSKEALVAALIARAKDRLRTHLEQVPAGEDHGRRLMGLGLAYLEFARQNPDLFRLALLDSPSDRRTLAVPVGQRSPYGILLEAVRDGLAAGTFHADGGPEAAEAIAYAVWSLVHGMAVLELGHLRHFQADFGRAHRHGLDLLIRGLCAGPRQEGGSH